MKRFTYLVAALILSVTVVFFFFKTENPQPKVTKVSTLHKPRPLVVTLPTIKYPSVTRPKRIPASGSNLTLPEKLNISPAKDALRIGNSYVVIEDLKALPKLKYQPNLGEKILEDDSFVFFRPAFEQEQSLPVAFNSSRQKLYPISHILHIKGIDTELREQLKTQGWQEYYYHPPLKLLSVKSTPARVINQYQELKARGFDVRLEVLKERPQAK